MHSFAARKLASKWLVRKTRAVREFGVLGAQQNTVARFWHKWMRFEQELGRKAG